MPSPKKLWSEIKYWIILLIVFLFLFEMISSMILYRKYTTGKFAILHFTERWFNKKPADEVFAYEPYLMFRLADHESDNVNITGFERKSNPATYAPAGSTDTISIFFFGGTSLYGESLTDAQTIPSQFVKLYQSSNPGKAITARNFGIPHYYSKQQLMLFSRFIFEKNKPDVAVFLNGMEDFSASRMLYYDRPWFSYALQQTFEGKMFQKGGGGFVDSTSELYEQPAGVDAANYSSQLISRYSNNLAQAAQLAAKAGIRTHFFCEPVPFFNSAAPSTNAKMHDRFKNIYTTLQQNADSIPNFHFLGNMPQSRSQNAFDGINPSPALSEAIAKNIFEAIKSDLQ